MSFRDALHEAAASYLRSEHGLDVAEVTSVDEETVDTGGCETCYYEYTSVNIAYLNSKGAHVYSYYGDFGEFITALDRNSE